MKYQVIENFLLRYWPELSESVHDDIDLCIETGGTIAACYRHERINAVGLFTIGTLEGNYKDKENGFIILLCSDSKGLHTSFGQVMFKIASYALNNNCDHVLFKCCIDQPKEIKLYNKFANQIKSCINSYGEQCVLFSSKTIDLTSFFEKYKKPDTGLNNKSDYQV